MEKNHVLKLENWLTLNGPEMEKNHIQSEVKQEFNYNILIIDITVTVNHKVKSLYVNMYQGFLLASPLPPITLSQPRKINQCKGAPKTIHAYLDVFSIEEILICVKFLSSQRNSIPLVRACRVD